jgi:hypothetical protein
MAGWTMPTSRYLALMAAAAAAPTSLASPDVQRVHTRTVEIDYDTDPRALPLTAVELWCSQDQGGSWSLCQRDEDRLPPITFQAPAEGLYGFAVVLKNPSGASSLPPASGTRPQIEAFIDFTPPVVQLHAPVVSAGSGATLVQVSWTAIDVNLEPRPITLSFRQAGDDTWHGVSDEPLANTGRYDWRPPTDLRGTVRLRAWATDLGGNRTESEERVFEINDPQPAASLVGSAERDLGLDTVVLGSPRTQQRVADLIAEAGRLRERGDLVGAIARLRDAVRLDPQAGEAFTSMGALLLQARDPERALEAFDLSLQQSPKDRDALYGAALALRDQRQYPAAMERLRTILRLRPADAEIWMALGDLAVFQGDELLARESYLRATRIDPKATTVIAEARQRLAIMDQGRQPPARVPGVPAMAANPPP